MNELIPCPFCGSKDIGGAGGIVSCYICGVETSKHPDTELAGLSWNNRVQPEDLTIDKCIEYLQKNIHKLDGQNLMEITEIIDTYVKIDRKIIGEY